MMMLRKRLNLLTCQRSKLSARGLLAAHGVRLGGGASLSFVRPKLAAVSMLRNAARPMPPCGNGSAVKACLNPRNNVRQGIAKCLLRSYIIIR